MSSAPVGCVEANATQDEISLILPHKSLLVTRYKQNTSVQAALLSQVNKRTTTT